MNCSNMTLWSTASVGKERKFLELYALKTISSAPQTGYDLLKSIEKKTDGKWVPSKGLIYPLLDEMEENGLIEIQEVGERSKKIYKITEKGVKELNTIREKHKELHNRFDIFRKLFFETFFSPEEQETAELFRVLRKKVMESSDKEEAKRLLQKVVEEIP
jgi:DNA-binding PadR family transcriptional regulator